MKIDKDDVRVRAIEPPECGECDAPATHTVWVDYRGAGINTSASEPLCYECAIERRDAMRRCLPDSEPEHDSED